MNSLNSNRKNVAGIGMLVPLQNGSMVKEINFDNAATTPPLKSVLNELTNFSPYYSSYHRGMGYKSQLSSALYDYSKEKILDFLQGDKSLNSVIYVKNTTEAINKLANMMKSKYSGSVVISTFMEHHSNDLPWREGFDIKYVDIDNNYRLSIANLETLLKDNSGKVKLVTVTGASNVTGYINPVHRIAEIVHKYGAKILVDGAQLIPHCKLNLFPNDDPKHIDFITFSSHKMYAPYGIGVLIGPTDELDSLEPDHKGGGTVDIVTHRKVTWDATPHKDEAGSPNIIGAAALCASIVTIEKMSISDIDIYERGLKSYLIHELKNIPEAFIYIDSDIEHSVGIVPFNVDGIPHEMLSKILSYDFGIATRSGCFCAQPYVQRILNISEEEAEIFRKQKHGRPGMVRVSFGLYNTEEEVERFISALKKIIKNKDKYLSKYSENDFSFF